MILSFDIGIRNLAYCFLEDDCQIKGWGIIDLMEEEVDDISTCCYEFKNGKKKGLLCCKKSVVMSGDIYLCKTHTPKGDNDMKKIKRAKVKKVKDITMLELGIKLVNKLDENLRGMVELYRPHTVVIELQPRFNPKMKNMSMMLYNYFIIRQIVDIEDNNLKSVKFVSARKKLTIYDGPYVACNLKDKYARTKYLGIKYCEYLIKEDVENTDLLNSHKKKDDLCDAYMQGIWYIKTKL